MEGAAGAGLGVDRFGHGKGMASPRMESPARKLPQLDKLTRIARRCLQLCRIYSGMDAACVMRELDADVCLGSLADESRRRFGRVSG